MHTDSANEDTKKFLLEDPCVVDVVMSQKPKRAVVHFLNKVSVHVYC